MKRALVAAAFLCLLAAAFRRQGTGEPNLVREIAPGVYYREAEPEKRIIANTGWIVMRDAVLVIDANFPWGARAVLPDIRRTTAKPVRYVFNTHYHSDHSFGNSVFVDAGATIICSEECAAESRALNTAAWNSDTGTGEYSLKAYRLEHPMVAFRDSMAIDDGTRRVELRRVGPGHTRGDAIAWLPRERVLFTGDLAVNRPGNFVGDPGADPDNWVRILDSLTRIDAAVVIPGHGTRGTVDTLRGNRAYLADMIAQIRAGIARGATSGQLAQSVSLKRHNPWGQDEERNRVSVRSIYARLTGRGAGAR
jgi:cyclase